MPCVTLYNSMWHYMRFCDIVIIWQLLTKTYHCQICIISYKFCLQAEFATFKNAKEKKESPEPHWNQFWCCCDIFPISVKCLPTRSTVPGICYVEKTKFHEFEKFKFLWENFREWGIDFQYNVSNIAPARAYYLWNKNRRSTNTDCQCQYKYIVVKIQLVRIITNGCLYLVN